MRPSLPPTIATTDFGSQESSYDLINWTWFNSQLIWFNQLKPPPPMPWKDRQERAENKPQTKITPIVWQPTTENTNFVEV